MTIEIDEAIERYTSNAEYERTHGNLQGCLEFRQLAEWFKDYKRLKEQKPTITSTVIKQMRDATPEEREAIAKYIKSISKPTGIEFDIDIDKKVESYGKLLKHPVIKSIMGMDETQEQIDFVQPHKRIPVTLTVSGDLISRQAVLDALEMSYLKSEIDDLTYQRIKKLPSVKPHTGQWIMRHRKVNTINYRTGEDVLTGEIHTVKELIRYECDEPYCSECGKRAGDTSGNYCCFCGARMESEQNG